MKMGPIVCFEISVTNYQSTLHKFPEERIFRAQKDLSTFFSNVLFFETRGWQVLWITQIPQGILDVVRFPHLLKEDSALLDNSDCMYRAVHRDTVTCFRSVLFYVGWWYRYLCKERGGCRVECQLGQLVSWRWGLTVLIRNWSYLGRAWHDGWMDALSNRLTFLCALSRLCCHGRSISFYRDYLSGAVVMAPHVRLSVCPIHLVWLELLIQNILSEWEWAKQKFVCSPTVWCGNSRDMDCFAAPTVLLFVYCMTLDTKVCSYVMLEKAFQTLHVQAWGK